MMAKLFRELVRTCRSRQIPKKPQSWHLMGTAEKDGLNKSNVKKFLKNDFITAHNSYFSDYVSEAGAAIEGDQFLKTSTRFQEFCHYHGLNREQYCAWIMLTAYQLFEDSKNFTEYNLKRICMMIWAFESISTSAMMTDDFIDNETIRWKQECWYRKPNVGNTIITDVNLLRMSAFHTLKKYFSHEPCYKSLINVLIHMVEGVAVGQTMDIEIQKKFKRTRELNCYTARNYFELATYKCYVPVLRTNSMAIFYLFNAQDEFYKYEFIFRKIGNHCQIENDLHDCFNNYESYGRYGSDIREGKLTWPIVTALSHASKEQKFLIQKNYARPEPECQKVIIDVYKEIDLLQKFNDYKNNLLAELLEIEADNSLFEFAIDSEMNKLFNEIVKRCNLRAISKKPQSWYLMGTVENDGLNKNNVKKILSDGDSINVQKSYFAQFVSEVAVEFEDKQFLTTFKRLQEFCNYNGLNREQYCAWLMLVAYQIFEEPEKLTVYNIKRICMMAWAFEALSTCAIMEDDLMDNETTRWKRECWHLKPEIGNTMITDNDVHDCFNNFKSFGRYGSDIREGKFSWPITVALEHANKKQKTLIKSNYARPEPECQKVVMDVYKEIDIVQKFYDYKNKLLVELRDDFKKVSNPKIIDYIEFYINFYIDVDFDLENK
ncbi:hypothetical protein FQR65_LT12365 [Abscondita terminalis]|nr:hypothetical protein FQR65_LT12365 [Abscondita terminalis]